MNGDVPYTEFPMSALLPRGESNIRADRNISVCCCQAKHATVESRTAFLRPNSGSEED